MVFISGVRKRMCWTTPSLPMPKWTMVPPNCQASTHLLCHWRLSQCHNLGLSSVHLQGLRSVCCNLKVMPSVFGGSGESKFQTLVCLECVCVCVSESLPSAVITKICKSFFLHTWEQYSLFKIHSEVYIKYCQYLLHELTTFICTAAFCCWSHYLNSIPRLLTRSITNQAYMWFIDWNLCRLIQWCMSQFHILWSYLMYSHISI